MIIKYILHGKPNIRSCWVNQITFWNGEKIDLPNRMFYCIVTAYFNYKAYSQKIQQRRAGAHLNIAFGT